MPNQNFALNLTYQKVKISGVIATMRAVGGWCQIVESESQPESGTVGFPLYKGDGPSTFASNMVIWARGTDSLAVITKEAE